MPQFPYQDNAPTIPPDTRIAPTAVISGDVMIGHNCSIGFGAVLTAESGPIRIGDNCVIMDGAILRGIRGNPLRIGDNVLIGPHAYLTGSTIGTNAFIATGATIFNGAVVSERAEVRINGIVHIRTRLPPDAVVPLGWIAVGDPAEILPPEAHERIWEIQKTLDFPRYVFGVERPAEGETIMPDVMPRYARFLVRRHSDDV
jgi:carbonic anhydrase/acetyltransferase-like protein (isoleucine patch superfamily)